jgi:hypothetical protein
VYAEEGRTPPLSRTVHHNGRGRIPAEFRGI